MLHIGLDVGSITAKIIVMDTDNNILYQDYQRHYADVKTTILGMLKAAQQKFPNREVTASIAGSAGLAKAKQVGIPFTQEVIAFAEAVEHYIPETDVAIELGGEDAKIVYFRDGIEQRMNAACAGGTGAFIDQISALLELDATGLNELAKGYQTIYPIASRCGVFAKTDVQPLLNEGARKEDIAASVFQSVVTQTVAGLACGRPIRGKVAFLGGPLTFLSELRQRFIETLELGKEEIIFPENSLYYVAVGAAMNGKKGEKQKLDDLVARFEGFSIRHSDAELETLPILFSDEEELATFRTRHDLASVPKSSLTTYEGPAFLGIDAGSTTMKITLMSEQDELLYTFYASNKGKPLQSVIKGLTEMYEQMPENVYIANSAVTGYGEGLIQAALNVDVGEIETVAHYKAAAKFQPNVDFILDIGGQDMKCIKIKNGTIDQLMLNEACSSGCGSFLESFAHSLNIPIEQFAKEALLADQPVDLGSRCTVFMNSKVKQVQKEGVTRANISAGLSYSVIKNAIQKVMRVRDTEELGENIVVQGGTFHNEAVLRTFENMIEKEVVRPDIAGMMGAYGCAIIAKERYIEGKSTILTLEELGNFEYKVTHSRCGLCMNHCPLTINRFKDKRIFITGNRCERGAGKPKRKEALPNLYKYKYERIFGYESLSEEEATRGTVGIPRAMNMYENYPLWHTFFTKLGYRVELSPRSSKEIFEQGMESIPSEAVCYPAKMTHGHITALVEKGVDFIFYPAVVFEKNEAEEATNHFNCPVVTSYPEVIRVNMDILKEENVPFIQPFLTLDNKKALVATLAEQFSHIPREEVVFALAEGFREAEAVKRDIQREGEETIAYLKETGKQGVVLAGRPYHIDPAINHGIAELITGFDMAVLTEDAIAHLSDATRDLRVVNQWTYHARLYRAARVVARHGELELVQLTSFGCGLDAVTADMVQQILEEHGKMFTLIKIDEINNLGAARIRIRSLQAAMKERAKTGFTPMPPQAPATPVKFTENMREDYTILVPQMSPIHFDLYEAALQSEGYRVKLLPTVSTGAVDMGLRFVNNDACYPAILTIGQMVHALKEGDYDLNKTAVIMSQTGGACRATNYIALLRKALKDTGMGQIPVISMNALGMEKHPGFKLGFTAVKKMIAATVYGDALMRVTNRIRPYEKEPGSTNALYEAWIKICKESIWNLRTREYKRNLRQLVEDFDSLPIYEDMVKPKVGIVGEILVKFHPCANNNIVRVIEEEGGEAVMPDILDFFLYCGFDRIYKGDNLGKGWKPKIISKGVIQILEHFRKPLKEALLASERFDAQLTIYELAEKASKLLSVGNQAGEGWFLTAEMMELIENGVNNIACIQPFACLPNHVTGRGMMKGLKEMYPQANITAIDYDASESEVNQINRLKLMLATAFKNEERQKKIVG